jgi:hypothetical protein
LASPVGGGKSEVPVVNNCPKPRMYLLQRESTKTQYRSQILIMTISVFPVIAKTFARHIYDLLDEAQNIQNNFTRFGILGGLISCSCKIGSVLVSLDYFLGNQEPELPFKFKDWRLFRVSSTLL